MEDPLSKGTPELPPFMEHPFMANEPDPTTATQGTTRSGRHIQAPVRMTFNATTNHTSIKSIVKRLLIGVFLVETGNSFAPATPPTATSIPSDINSNPKQFSPISMMSASESEKMIELQTLDQMNAVLCDDDDDNMWKCLRILDHRLRQVDPDDVHVKVKVLFNNGDVNWN